MAGVNRPRGFTLTELAIVMFIVSLLIGGMLMPLSAQQEVRARASSETSLAEIREALIGFAIANKRLPCPAKSATDGEELASCTTEAQAFGFVPWASLGVTRQDAWNTMIRYSVTPALAVGIDTGAVGTRRVLSSIGGNYLAGTAGGCSSAGQCAAAVLVAQAKNGPGNKVDGLAQPDPSTTNLDEKANHAGPTDFYSRPATDNSAAAGGEFDDLVVWLPTSILLSRLASAGSLD